MLSLFRRKKQACSNFLDALDDAANAVTLQEFLAAAPQRRAHAASCEDCRIAAGEFLAARALLSALPAQADRSRPSFASKVMAAIAARETDVRRLATAWTLVPRLASRLACISALAILSRAPGYTENPSPLRPVKQGRRPRWNPYLRHHLRSSRTTCSQAQWRRINER